MKPRNPVLVYTIKLQPKTGKYSLRDGTDFLIGVFDTYAEAEQYADQRFARNPKRWTTRKESHDGN